MGERWGEGGREFVELGLQCGRAERAGGERWECGGWAGREWDGLDGGGDDAVERAWVEGGRGVGDVGEQWEWAVWVGSRWRDGERGGEFADGFAAEFGGVLADGRERAGWWREGF